jgi:cytochrome c peroxidase
MSCVKDEAVAPIDIELERTLLRLSENGSLDDYKLPDGSTLSAIPAGVGNTITEEKVALGRMLFFETGLARDANQVSMIGTFSCSTCHVPEAAFTAGSSQGIADGAVGFGLHGSGRTMADTYDEQDIDAQGARPLSMLGVAYVTNSMWAGRFGAHGANEDTEDVWGVHDPATEVNHLGLDGLEAQNIEGTVTHRLRVDEYVLDTLGYRPHFDAAFGEWNESVRYGREALSFALSAYIRTLLPDQAPWQRWLKGEKEALSFQEKEGALLFFGKAGCYRCHNGPALNGNTFQALGVNDLSDVGGLRTSADDTRNLGRGDFTRRPEDNFKFKVPQLYNTKDMPFFFHGSSHTSLESLIEYFNNGVAENPRVPEGQLSEYFHPLNLTDQEMEDLKAFLAEGLYDPDLNRYAPTEVLSGNCIPNNDPASRSDIGCE